MQSLSRKNFLKIFNYRSEILKEFHVNSADFAWRSWREARKLPQNPNAFGPLTNLPDYSFKDGRPVPFGANQKKRIDVQRENLIKIKKYSDQLDSAVEIHKKLLKQKEEEKQKIIDRKLKEKGDKLITK